MNPLGEFRARPSSVLSIRRRCGFHVEYRRKMQEMVDSWGSDEAGPASGTKSIPDNSRPGETRGYSRVISVSPRHWPSANINVREASSTIGAYRI